MIYCPRCYRMLQDGTEVCTACGKPLTDEAKRREAQQKAMPRCSKCGSTDIDIQLHQEDRGGSTITTTKSHYRQKGHGCLWWLIFGWWWWIVDLMLWIFLFPIRFLFQLFRKKEYIGNSSSVASTRNNVVYRTVFLCKTCGHHWQK